jgi:4'-phosphopantetheinyl transferase
MAAPPRLECGRVHVWQLRESDWDARLAELQGALSFEDAKRANKHYFPKDRARYIAGHGLLRILLGSYLHLEPAQIRFVNGPHGKPSVDPSAHSADLRFNLSDTDGVAIVGLCRSGEIGIDIERIRDDFPHDEIAERFYSHRENSDLVALPADERRRAFYAAWTRKEALVKATGAGLSGIDAVQVPVAPWRPSQGRVWPLTYSGTDWNLFDLDAGNDYAATLVVEAGSVELHCFRFSF